ncbi:MAG: hypothetical protein AAFW75_11805 [Cyanobacteria bacterium J06636_16]
MNGSALFNLGMVYLEQDEPEQVWRCWLHSLAVFAQMGLDYRIRGTLDSLYWLLCRTEDVTFIETEFSRAALAQFFAEPLAEIQTSFGEETVDLVLDTLMKR